MLVLMFAAALQSQPQELPLKSNPPVLSIAEEPKHNLRIVKDRISQSLFTVAKRGPIELQVYRVENFSLDLGKFRQVSTTDTSSSKDIPFLAQPRRETGYGFKLRLGF